MISSLVDKQEAQDYLNSLNILLRAASEDFPTTVPLGLELLSAIERAVKFGIVENFKINSDYGLPSLSSFERLMAEKAILDESLSKTKSPEQVIERIVEDSERGQISLDSYVEDLQNHIYYSHFQSNAFERMNNVRFNYLEDGDESDLVGFSIQGYSPTFATIIGHKGEVHIKKSKKYDIDLNTDGSCTIPGEILTLFENLYGMHPELFFSVASNKENINMRKVSRVVVGPFYRGQIELNKDVSQIDSIYNFLKDLSTNKGVLSIHRDEATENYNAFYEDTDASKPILSHQSKYYLFQEDESLLGDVSEGKEVKVV